MGSGFKLITDAALREFWATLGWYGHTEDDFEESNLTLRRKPILSRPGDLSS